MAREDTKLHLDIHKGFVIGEWQAYPELNRLLANEVTRTLEGKVMAVLVELAKQPFDVVSKNSLLDAVWPNQDVADGVLTRAVHELRNALRDDPKNSRYIETVPRRGYRLICQPEAIVARTHRNRLRWALIGSAFAAAAVAAYWGNFASFDDAPVVDSVAVLPFTNLTGSPAKDHIGDSLADAIIHTIAQQPDIGVTARTSSFALRDSGLTGKEIGERLGVDHIIEGSIREERGVQRITIQLIDVSTGLQDSSVTLDVVDGDLFASQQRISMTIESMLADAGASISLDAYEQLPATVSQAYDLFLRGRAALQNRSAESLRNARAYFEEALALDPQFAAAHAGLAQFYLVSRAYLRVDSGRSQALAFAAASDALALDPDNVDALMVAAAVAGEREDFETAIHKLQLAIELQPSNAQAHQWYGETLTMLGYISAGRDAIETALILNPLAGSTNTVRAKVAAFFLDDEKLLLTANQGDALGAMLSPRELAVHYFRIGDARAFGREIGRYHKVVGVDASAAGILTAAMRGSIDPFELLDQLAPLGAPIDNFFARELAFLGMHEEALDATIRGSVSGGAFQSDIWLPEFRGARALPAFIGLVETLNLDQYWRAHGLPDVCRQASPESFCSQFAN